MDAVDALDTVQVFLVLAFILFIVYAIDPVDYNKIISNSELILQYVLFVVFVFVAEVLITALSYLNLVASMLHNFNNNIPLFFNFNITFLRLQVITIVNNFLTVLFATINVTYHQPGCLNGCN